MINSPVSWVRTVDQMPLGLSNQRRRQRHTGAKAASPRTAPLKLNSRGSDFEAADCLLSPLASFETSLPQVELSQLLKFLALRGGEPLDGSARA